MIYTTEQVADGGLKLSYRFYSGNKKEILFLFHGFGQSNNLFDTFAGSLLPDYSIVAVDLFFHGESTAETNEVDFISIERWNALFDLILARHQIDRFSLLSYSMGSRFIAAVLKSHASRVNSIAFIAPDGFGNNFWFRIATSTVITRYLFKCTMDNPSWIRRATAVLGVVGIFNSITKRFILRNLESADHRKKIYSSWVYFRELTIASDEFVALIRTYKINFICFCGKQDQLVAKDTMQILCDQTAARYIELDLAHHKMVQVLGMTELNNFLVANRQ